MARMDLSRMAAAAVEAALEAEQGDAKPQRRGVTGMRAVAAGALLAVAAGAAARKVPKSSLVKGALAPAVGGLGGKVRDRVTDKLSQSGWLPGDDDDFEDDLPEDEFDDDEFDDDEFDDDEFDEPEATEEDEGEDEPEDEPEASEDDEDEDDDGWDDEAPDDDEPQAGGDGDEPSDDQEDDDEEPDEPQADADDDEPSDDEAEAEDEDLADRPAASEDENFDDDDGSDEDEDDDRERGRPAPAIEIDVGTAGDNGRQRSSDGAYVLGHLSPRRKPPLMSSRRRGRGPIDPAARPPEPPEDAASDRGGKSTKAKGKAKAGRR